jgi:hypothetical protein
VTSGDDIRSDRIPATACPGCRKVIDAVTGTGRAKPGDVTMCAYCLVFLIFTDLMEQRLLTNREWLALPSDQRALLARVRDRWMEQRPCGVEHP